MSVRVAAFYRFVAIEDCEALRSAVLDRCEAAGIRGTVLIAAEGINGTVSGEPGSISDFLGWLLVNPRFVGLDVKLATADAHPFRRLKVKVKREILTFGVPGTAPAARTGKRVAPQDWNALISDPDVLVIDTRNAYEVEAGTFPGAVDPGTRTFTEFQEFARVKLDPKRDRRIAMFCTGGIRCEKASAYLLSLGFPEVYQLDGGILRYLEKVPENESRWQGQCFVFDERGVVEALGANSATD